MAFVVFHDLPADETYRQLVAALKSLQKTSEIISSRIQEVVSHKRERLASCNRRLEVLHAKLASLQSGTQPVTALASATYPTQDVLHGWTPLFPPSLREPAGAVEGAEARLPPGPPADGRVRGQDTAELHHFFQQAQMVTAALDALAGPVAAPADLTSAPSLSGYAGPRSRTDEEPQLPASTTLALAQALTVGAQHALGHGQPWHAGSEDGRHDSPPEDDEPAARAMREMDPGPDPN
ncbi:hypothetical protein WJX81_003458 [Elliptochloris bilobata]|uniref:WASH1 WAHD domain-containing protein n=1 Tax=Elliptochloris bilobata TaxID=381761 RepID=A0AAW1QVD3_9CHLO